MFSSTARQRLAQLMRGQQAPSGERVGGLRGLLQRIREQQSGQAAPGPRPTGPQEFAPVQFQLGPVQVYDPMSRQPIERAEGGMVEQQGIPTVMELAGLSSMPAQQPTGGLFGGMSSSVFDWAPPQPTQQTMQPAAQSPQMLPHEQAMQTYLQQGIMSQASASQAEAQRQAELARQAEEAAQRQAAADQAAQQQAAAEAAAQQQQQQQQAAAAAAAAEERRRQTVMLLAPDLWTLFNPHDPAPGYGPAPQRSSGVGNVWDGGNQN